MIFVVQALSILFGAISVWFSIMDYKKGNYFWGSLMAMFAIGYVADIVKYTFMG